MFLSKATKRSIARLAANLCIVLAVICFRTAVACARQNDNLSRQYDEVVNVGNAHRLPGSESITEYSDRYIASANNLGTAEFGFLSLAIVSLLLATVAYIRYLSDTAK